MLLKKKITIDSIWNLAGLGVLGVSGIIINVLIARYSGPEALGIFNQVYAFYILQSQMSVFGIHLSVLKHVSYNRDNHVLIAEIVNSAVILCLVISSAFAFFTFIFREIVGTLMQSREVAFGLGLVSLGLIGFAVNKVFFFTLNGFSLMREYAVFQSVRFILILVGVAIVGAMSLPGQYFAASLTFAELLLMVIMGVYVFGKIVPLRPSAVSMKWSREHISFGARSFFSGVFIVVNTRLDVLTLGYFLNDRLVGIYSFAAIIAEGIGQIPTIIRQNLDPVLGKYFSENNIQEIKRITRKVKRVFFPLMFGLCLAAVLLYPIGLDIFVKDAGFEQSILVFVILVAGVLLNALYKPFVGIFSQGARPGIHSALAGVLFIFNLMGCVLLIPILGIVGAAVANACILILEAVLIHVLARRFFGISL